MGCQTVRDWMRLASGQRSSCAITGENCWNGFGNFLNLVICSETADMLPGFLISDAPSVSFMIMTLERCNKKNGGYPRLSIHGNSPAKSEGLWGILGGRLAWYEK